MTTETTTRTTTEVANELVNKCRQGDYVGAINELYGENIVSHEPPGAQAPERVEGFENVRQKTIQWGESVAEVHNNEVSDPVVAGNHFSVKFNVDCTFKEHGRMQMEEIGVYEVNNGKVVNERFYYTMG